MKMIFDSREHALIELVSQSTCAIVLDDTSAAAAASAATVKTLDVGDIWVGLSGEELVAGSLIVERKTVADFEASFMDKRYREQRTRLLAVCQEKGAKPVYIIEGAKLEGRKLGEQAIRKLLFRLALRYGVTVIHTRSLADTLDTLRLLEVQIEEDRDVFKTPTNFSYVETIGAAKKESGDTPRVFAVKALTGCRGVSVKGAEALLEAFGGTLAGVWEASEDELAKVRAGARPIGKAVAGRLWGLLHGATTAAT